MTLFGIEEIAYSSNNLREHGVWADCSPQVKQGYEQVTEKRQICPNPVSFVRLSALLFCDSNVKTTNVRLLLCAHSMCRSFHPCKVSTCCTLRGQIEWDMWTQWGCLDGAGSLCPGQSSKDGTVPSVLSVGSRAYVYLSATLIFSLGKAVVLHIGAQECGFLRTHHPDWWTKQMSSWLQIYKEYWSLYEIYINIYMGVLQSIHWIDNFLKLRFCNYVLCLCDVVAKQL